MLQIYLHLQIISLHKSVKNFISSVSSLFDNEFWKNTIGYVVFLIFEVCICKSRDATLRFAFIFLSVWLLKNIIICVYFVLVSIPVCAQSNSKMGVNTRTPDATLYVKSASSTATDKNLQLENASGVKMVTVLNNGNMGIGTVTPSTNLVL